MITIMAMDKMKEREFAEYARDVPAFTARQVTAMLGDRAYAKLFIHRMVSRGIIRNVARGVYTAHQDPVIYASHIRYPSYISLWYAFQHHGFSEQLPRVVEVMARGAGAADGVEFLATRHLWGYGPEKYSGFQIFMAEPEKAVMDAILTGRIPITEILPALAKCNPVRLEELVLKLDAVSIRKVGYVAEKGGVFLQNAHKRLSGDRNYAHLSVPVGKNSWRVVK
jgi:predicted transcriptional regulator of viral defense system